MTFSQQEMDQQMFNQRLMVLSKNSAGALPHRKPWDKPTNTLRRDQRMREQLQACLGPVCILK